MNHIALLGDSIFDNAVYVEDGPDVRSQLQSILPNNWKVSLFAVDGSRIQDTPAQIRLFPKNTSLTIMNCQNYILYLHPELSFSIAWCFSILPLAI